MNEGFKEAFKEPLQINNTPLLKDLYQQITPQHAAHWKVIGTLLGLPSGELKAIEAGWPTNVKWCCNQMLEKWLDIDPTASWQKLFTVIESASSTPLLKDLYDKITPQYAIDWKVIGTLLGLPIGELKAIEAGYPTNVKWCCNQMLEKWLVMNPTATWGDLFTAIESPAVSCSVLDKVTPLFPKLQQLTISSITGGEALAKLTNRVSQINIHTRFIVSDESWPPKQPTSFTPLLFLYHQGDYCTPEQVKATAKMTYTGDIGRVASATEKPITDSQEKVAKATKEIEEILAPLESKESTFVLIEGAPGIGKTVLLKEIANKWGNKQLLEKYALVLLVSLRDPSLRQIKSISNLLCLFYKGEDDAAEIVGACSKYLSDNGGKGLTLLLDGYDEYPDDLRQKSLIAEILKREVLPLCGLVVSSRPHASQDLRKRATIRVDILGFTEAEREHYIKQALPDQPHKITELTQYLHQRPSVYSICFIPFNMVILLYLYELGDPLPRNSPEMYRHFIYSTICRHLSKSGNPLKHDITDLNNLPEPYNRIIKQLSKFSFEALNSNKLTFTLDEITAVCPDIAAVPGAINGFGLLQVVQHYGLYTKTITLNFIHFTIQEFLAAHYVSHLPPHEELKVIEANFWNDIHFNMFSIYIAITKGQRPSFKAFLSDGKKAIVIADKFLEDQLKCLRLYYSFKQADDHTMCNTIDRARTFHNKKIKLRFYTLTASDMECISLFLISSFNKTWELLDLKSSYMQDEGLSILYHGLHDNSDITINKLLLYNNGLTTKSSSLISKLIVKYKVKVLGIGNNTIGEDRQLYSMLTNPSNVLEKLHMSHARLSSTAAIDLFTALKDNNKLKLLDIQVNDVTDDATDAITTTLEKNSCLSTLLMYYNPLSGEAITNIVRCLKVNNKLQVLGLPRCSEDNQKNIKYFQEVVNKERESRGCQITLEIKFI